MRTTVVAFLIVLSGCGGNSGSNGGSSPSASLDNHGYGFQYDAEGSRGLHLRWSGSSSIDAKSLEARADTIEICAGITAPPPPFVIIVPKDSLGPPIVGLYLSAPPLILLDQGWIPRYEHEMLHYLLDYATGNADPDHKQPVWASCLEDSS